jgi:DNA mismatch repair protein MutL
MADHSSPLGESRIRRLPDSLVDQIAAGEVVERPASVAKELVENALDAGASRIAVEVRGGGAELVAVSDDGCGLSAADARLALERHATSKLLEAADLGRIRTYGFRGEALPAIASVSRLRLRSRTADAEEGVLIRVEDGRVVENRATGARRGTRVEVADLFHAVPARRKFLKSEGTEWGHVLDWLSRAALVLPAIHFEIRRDDRPAQVWPAARSHLDRIAAVLSERDAQSLVAGELRQGRAELLGFFSRPDAHRATASGLHLFVNQRPVRDRLLRHALLEAYREVLPRGRFPTAVVYLTVPPEEVDVNVHPAKWEVRFADPQAIHRLVSAAVRGCFESRAWLASPQSGGTDARPLPGTLPVSTHAGQAAAGTTDWLFAQPAGRASDLPAPPPEALGEALRFADLRRLGQLLGTYLVLEHKDGLLLVDQHAAHERVLYERLRSGWLEQSVERQALLVPEIVELPGASFGALEGEAELVIRLGFEVEGYDERSVAVRAVPALLAGRDPAALVRGLADELSEAARVGTDVSAGPRLLDLADRTLATLACHAARTAGEVLDEREQRALLESVDGIPWAPTCPHGRPVAIPFPLHEIERRFARR